MTTEIITVFVNLLDEGIDVIRPTKALSLGNGFYKLLPTENYDPEIETWELLPNATVAVEQILTDTDKKVLLAVKA